MEDNNSDIEMAQVYCNVCNDIKKIKITTNWNDRSITVSFECNHERKNQVYSRYFGYCENCKKYIEEEKSCKISNHHLIKRDDLSFYCIIHIKKYNAYCEMCKKNLCDECICQHEDIKYNFEYYFSNSQIQELLNIYNEAQNFIKTVYSLECNRIISEDFENYYNIHLYMHNRDLFHINIIYNINLFYNFFKVLIKSKLIISGDFFNFEINNIADNTIFYDSKFKQEFNNLISMSDFNFNDILKLFLLSKRFKIDNDLFEMFSIKINELISNNISSMNRIESKIDKLKEKIKNSFDGINTKKIEIIKIQNEINYEILSLKLPKISVPSNLKRKLISITQREIIKKYKNYLHKIKPNVFILNDIKKKYENLKKQNNKIFESLNLEEKFNEINNISTYVTSNFIDNVYFETNFNLKNLLNAFLFFTQELHYQKSNETHYSNQNQILPLNQINIKFPNSNVIKTLNGNNSNGSALNSQSDRKPNIKLNNDEKMKEHKKYLMIIKNKFKNSNKDIFIKKKINLKFILEALFQNNYSNIIEIVDNNDDIEIDKFISDCLDELNKYEYKNETSQHKDIIRSYEQIKNNNFFKIGGKIFSILAKNKKYKDIIKEIKEDFDNDSFDNEKDNKNTKLVELLVNYGGFDKRNANLIMEIINNYLDYSQELIDLDKEMKKYKFCDKENSEMVFEIKQLNYIKDYLQNFNEKLNDYNDNYELNELSKIQNNFEINSDKYINNTDDNSYKQALKEIKEFIQGKKITTILESVKDFLKDEETNFYTDESINLVTYCWGIQNGHEYIVDL